MKKVQCDVDKLNWDAVLNCLVIEECVNMCHEELLHVVNEHASMRILKLHDNASARLNTDYLSHCDEHWASKFEKHPTDENLRHKIESAELTSQLKQSLQWSYFQELLNNTHGDAKIEVEH